MSVTTFERSSQMQLVEKHVISKQHKFWKECDYLALQSKHLYNAATYIQRQYFFETNTYYNSIDIYHQTKNNRRLRPHINQLLSLLGRM